MCHYYLASGSIEELLSGPERRCACLGYSNALPLLSEEDVPGASFIHAKIEKHSVDQLRRGLACHGINTLGNKTARQKSTMK